MRAAGGDRLAGGQGTDRYDGGPGADRTYASAATDGPHSPGKVTWVSLATTDAAGLQPVVIADVRK